MVRLPSGVRYWTVLDEELAAGTYVDGCGNDPSVGRWYGRDDVPHEDLFGA
jgi:hypothetical protein